MSSVAPVSVSDGRRRILFVDAFDSFTNNIVGLLQQSLNADVSLVHIDDKEIDRNLNEILGAFDAVVVGPGPGHPANPADVGFITRLWELSEAHMLPILGICLGFQSLCHSHGAKVRKLRRARHGIVSSATHNGTDIFSGIHHLEATQYHSLHADIGDVAGDDITEKRIFWEPSQSCPSLRPLAWDAEDKLNGSILMAVRHTAKPFWGVQFHPESICTSEAGKDLVSNWWMHAKEWLFRRNRIVVKDWDKMPTPGGSPRLTTPVPDDASSRYSASSESNASHMSRQLGSIAGADDVFLRWGRHPAANIAPTTLIDALGYTRDEVVVLDSQGHASGRFSILGLVVPGKTMKVTYKVTDRTMRYGLGPGQMYSSQLKSIDDIWPILQDVLDTHDPRNRDRSSRASTPGAELSVTGMDNFVAGHLPTDSPFWGGFMGYISYEAGLETIDVAPHESCAAGSDPDMNFAFIHRSIVIDHATSQIYIQSLLPGDWAWILNAGRTIDGLASQAEIRHGECEQDPEGPNGAKSPLRTDVPAAELHDSLTLDDVLATADVDRPREEAYRAKVLRSQEFLASGDSYELCLTDETQITVPFSDGDNGLDEWALYKRLRRNNPAPFGAFVRLSDVVVVGSSPERFLRWTRDGHCQFRPIKGTVKKSAEMTRERAHAILDSSKERAENLMIVDLIRHDLSGVIGADKTWVSKLMVVEEYETVYQLVSVIEGQLPDPETDQHGPRGLSVLKASLPPGSMTGAPKKRSCEILRGIEQRPRGIYSGVLGYMDVGGAGDFSVVIRTAMRGSTSPGSKTTRGAGRGPEPQSETWHVGAGGAVTIQSTDEGEFLEMEVKATSVLGSLLPKSKIVGPKAKQ